MRRLCSAVIAFVVFVFHAAAWAQAYDPLNPVAVASGPPRSATPAPAPSRLGTAVAEIPPAGGWPPAGPDKLSAPPPGTVFILGPRPASWTWQDLWPVNSLEPLKELGDLKFPDSSITAIWDFEDAGNSTASWKPKAVFHGSDYDSHLQPNGDYSIFAVARRAGAMKVGEMIRWTGLMHTGRFTVIGDHALGPFPCRQVKLELFEGGKKETERRALFCYSKDKGEYDYTWREVLVAHGRRPTQWHYYKPPGGATPTPAPPPSSSATGGR